jgi:hypothetical protein
MKKYSSLIVILALLVIIISVFSGFANPSIDSKVEELLEQRTSILQKTFYNQITKEKAEKELEKLETYPLLTEDIRQLRQWDNTEIDTVKSMQFIEVIPEKNLLEYTTYKIKIMWEMSGINEDYTMEGTYNVVMKKSEGKYKLSCFNAL